MIFLFKTEVILIFKFSSINNKMFCNKFVETI